MMDFREVLSFCDLHDLGFSGAPWTYDNKQRAINNVSVRLDCAVANHAWSNIYPNCTVSHLSSSRSDHCPILLKLEQDTAKRIHCPIRRYEACWEREESVAKEVKIAWEGHSRPSDLGEVASNLSGVMNCLHKWSRKTVGAVPNRIEKLGRKLNKINNRNSLFNQEEKYRVEKELDNLLEQEEITF